MFKCGVDSEWQAIEMKSAKWCDESGKGWTADVLFNSICQKPKLASIFENMVAFSNDANDCSTKGSKCLSLHTALFNFVRSTHILTPPFPFGTTTIPAHQDVGSSILEMTPSCSIHFNSALTFGSKEIGTWCGVVSTKGTALGISLIWYAPFNVPSPLNNLGNCFITVSLFRPEFLHTGSTLS